MKRFLLIGRVSVIAALAAVFATSDAAASHPDILRNYRFIPSHSTLEVTGGFAGVDWDLTIAGKFGLVTGYEEGYTCLAIGCPPSHIPFAQFVDVDAIVYNPLIMAPIPLPGWDLDETLNLSGLDGTFLPTAPNHLLFQGKDGQGAPIRIEAVLRGPIIHLTGANNPNCTGCADFFGYKLDAFAYLTPHPDVNLDGVVDAADYVVWRKTLGQSGTGIGGEGAINTGDYDLWRADFGTVVDFSEFATADLNAGSVPEPTTISLLLAGIAYLLLRRRK